MNEAQLAYIAGIVDGEACIGVSRRKPRGFSPRVSIGMTNQPVLAWIHGLAGGSLRKENRKKGKTMYRLDWPNQKAAIMLRQILPYLIVKADEAKLLIRLTELKAVNNHKGKVPVTNWEDQTLIASQLAAIKKGQHVPIVLPEIKPIDKPIACGTRWGYAKGCRCKECKFSNAEHAKGMRQKQKG